MPVKKMAICELSFTNYEITRKYGHCDERATGGKGDAKLAQILLLARPAPSLRSGLRLLGFVEALQAVGHHERHLERLLAVEARVAVRLVRLVEVLHADAAGAAHALGDVRSSHLEVHAARVRALRLVHVEEGLKLFLDGRVVARLEATARAGDGVAVHGVAHPRDHRALLLDGANEARQMVAQLLGSHAGDEREPPRRVVGVHHAHELDELIGGHLVGDLDAHRVGDTAHELDVRAVQLARALARPHEVRAAVVPQPRRRVLAGERGLVVHQQALVARVELSLGKRRRVLGDAGGLHELDRLAHLGGELVEALALLRVAHEVELPVLHSQQAGVAAAGEGAEQVERGGALVVRAHEPLGVGHARLGRVLGAVDDVAAVRRQLHAVHHLGVRGARLGELPRHAPHLDHGRGGAVHEHDAHLQDDAEEVADAIGGEVVKRLGTVAAEEHEAVALGGRRQPLLQPSHLACEHERRHALQLLHHALNRRAVGVVGLLQDGPLAPAVAVPVGQMLRVRLPRHARQGLAVARRRSARARRGRV
mmetsp:Transcript_9099/g.37231  ORF Transcript_9099/g.37231 Transcript_9099/m.37231 type:complete len:538 (+) Transcript_9099:2377-3990(+)